MGTTKRVVLVTGAMGGLGTAICKTLAQEGFTVVGSDLPGLAKKDEWLKEMQAAGCAVHLVLGDVSDYDSCQRMVSDVEQIVGPVDVLVNNAGITRDAPLRKMTKDMWDAVMATNCDSLFNMTKPVIDGMVSRGWGRVINISSVNGVKGQRGQANYSTAKAGTLGFTMALAQEVASKGVTVNAIAPGYVATPMVMAIKQEIRDGIVATIPIGRLGKPEEIAHLVAYLASDLAGNMTGATLNINGGMHMC